MHLRLRCAGSNATLSTLRLEPLSPSIGAAVHGVDLSRPLDDATFAALSAAFHRHMLLRFSEQQLDAAQQLAFSRRFGELQVHVLDQYRHPQYPEIYVLSNIDAATGKPMGHHPDKGTLTWHSDLSFQRRPALATILYGIETPASGGETQFADMAAAYDALDDETKRRVAGLRCVHDLDHSRRRMGEPSMTEAQRRQTPPVEHPLVRTHPATGRKILYISRHVSHIAGLPSDGKRGAARTVDGACHRAALRLRLPLATARCADVGQPLHDAPRDELRHERAAAGDPPHRGAGRHPGVALLRRPGIRRTAARDGPPPIRAARRSTAAPAARSRR